MLRHFSEDNVLVLVYLLQQVQDRREKIGRSHCADLESHSVVLRGNGVGLSYIQTRMAFTPILSRGGVNGMLVFLQGARTVIFVAYNTSRYRALTQLLTCQK